MMTVVSVLQTFEVDVWTCFKLRSGDLWLLRSSGTIIWGSSKRLDSIPPNRTSKFSAVELLDRFSLFRFVPFDLKLSHNFKPLRSFP